MVGDPDVEFCGTALGPGAGFYRADDPRGCQHSLPPLTAAQAVYLYRTELTDFLADPDPYYDELRAALNELRGHDLACWCPLVGGSGQAVPCHADVLLELANTPRIGAAGVNPEGAAPATAAATRRQAELGARGGAAVSVEDTTPASGEPSTVPLATPAPCRHCGDPAYRADESGPVHRCCELEGTFVQHRQAVLEADQIRAGRPCTSCSASKAYWRTRRR